MVLSAAAVAAAIRGSAERNPVRTPPVQAPAITQIIVKLREAQSNAGPDGTPLVSAQERIANLAMRSGVNLAASRPITARMQVIQLQYALAEDSLEAMLARLRADPDIEYAEPDARRYPHALPNDPLFPNAALSQSGQWYLQSNPAVTPAAVNAQAAWDVTTGDAGLVIADLDTGVRFDHPDLLRAAANGRLLPGYDFISDPATANDGDGRDADASDPGDWITTADSNTTQFKGCTVADSSWHGTRTAGVLGALTNNSTGVAGMIWTGRILPVRVLGKCGGVDSDIISGMLWAAGIHVQGVPDNATPAKILNMSLGGTGSCPLSYVDAISQIVARGVLIVASAGNEGGPVDAPANCAGVAAIAGIRQVGTKVGYSSLGPQVALSAPAGNCVNSTINPQSPCEYPIETTVNLGTRGPGANGYTDQVYDPNLGTSFSAPIVSGIAALMSAVNPHLSSCQLVARLQEGSQPFPQTSLGAATQPPACHVPASSTDLQNSECLCTTDGKTCGTGMANASGAVEAALRPIAVLGVPASVKPGQSIALDAQGSIAASGHTITGYQWTNAGAQSVALENDTSPVATVTAPSCGYATVKLAVTDDAARADVATVVLSPTSATSTAPGNADSPSCSTTAPKPLLAVCPASASVLAGSGTQSFTASLANTSNAAVTWTVNSIPGGNSTVGTISTDGLYTAPATVPSPSTVLVQAVSQADQSVTSSTSVMIAAPPSPHGGGGAVDLFTLFVNALAVAIGAIGAIGATQTRRCAASSHAR